MAPKTTRAEREAEAKRVARLAIGQRTVSGWRTIEDARVDPFHPTEIIVTFAGFGLAPFRAARYTAKEVLAMIDER